MGTSGYVGGRVSYWTEKTVKLLSCCEDGYDPYNPETTGVREANSHPQVNHVFPSHYLLVWDQNHQEG